MLVPLGQQTARLCKSVKEFARFSQRTQWISGYYHFFLNGVSGPTYIHGRSLGILFEKLRIFRQRAISFKPPVTANADSNSQHRFIIDNRKFHKMFCEFEIKVISPHFGETGCPFPVDGAALCFLPSLWPHEAILPFCRP